MECQRCAKDRGRRYRCLGCDRLCCWHCGNLSGRGGQQSFECRECQKAREDAQKLANGQCFHCGEPCPETAPQDREGRRFCNAAHRRNFQRSQHA